MKPAPETRLQTPAGTGGGAFESRLRDLADWLTMMVPAALGIAIVLLLANAPLVDRLRNVAFDIEVKTATAFGHAISDHAEAAPGDLGGILDQAAGADVTLLGGSPRGGLVLASGDARQTLAGDLVASPGLGQMLQASTHRDSPALARFARTGDLSLVDRGRTVNLDATPLDRPGVTRFFAVPAALQMLVNHPRCGQTDFSRLKYIFYGAAPIPLELLRQCVKAFGCQFAQAYGMTETTGTVVMLPPQDHDPNGSPRMRAAGKPVPGVEVKIMSEEIGRAHV